MEKSIILQLISDGNSRDNIYQIGAGEMGLFGVAFFGYSGSSNDRMKLSRLWKRILKYYPSSHGAN